jgi:hypothetical protein
MKVTLESTDKIVELQVNGATVPARVWEGVSEGGAKCHAYITRIGVAHDQNQAEFEKELRETRAPSPALQAIPLRLII